MQIGHTLGRVASESKPSQDASQAVAASCPVAETVKDRSGQDGKDHTSLSECFGDDLAHEREAAKSVPPRLQQFDD